MAILKCKMCGGDMEISADKTFGTCEYCGSTMTLPKVNDEQRAAAFNRGNHFRRSGEFDKALAVYERIVSEDDTDAEAHWCCALCRFGIEYVEDPATFEWLPTCHRASFDSFLEDVDYLAAVENSDGITKRQYQKDAAKIAEVQRGILATSQNAEPYDVFISYKELDKDGNRTRDSILAQDIYYQLTEQGRRVFFSRITLEDVPGTQYEPYIFAALNSAKVMIVVGTSAENLNAVWVKNEWSRYLSMMRKDRSKLLLPCYRDMDPYDLPEQLSVLMSYDMGKIGFIQDLIRGVNKVLDADKKHEAAAVRETVVVQQNSGTNVEPLLKRVFMFLEDGDWKSADEYCERVLDQDPENAYAYVGKLMAELHVRKQEQLKNCKENFGDNDNYIKILRFGMPEPAKTINGYVVYIIQRNEEEKKNSTYNNGLNIMNKAKSESDFFTAAEIFSTLPGYKEADKLAAECREKAEITRKDDIYSSAKAKMSFDNIINYEGAIRLFESVPGWKDADKQIEICRKRIEELKAKEEADRIEAERKAEAERAEAARKAEEKRIAREKAAKKRNKIAAIVAAIAAVCIAAFIVVTKVIIPNNKYNAAVALMDAGQYDDAIAAFEAIEGFKDSNAQIKNCRTALTDIDYNAAVALMDAGQYDDAIAAFNALNGYKDSETLIENCYIGEYGEEKGNLIKNTNVGDTFTFGTYEQDNNISNGKEAIEWIVLNKDGASVLLISKQALDCQQYNTEYTDVTWESCSLRKWMNGTFLNNAFSAEEQAQIQNTTVSADKNPQFDTNPGNATTDKVFLLSITEAEKYFTTDESRKCAPTAYAKAQGAWTSNSYNTSSGAAACWWWLRSPGSDQLLAAYIYGAGSVYCDGHRVDSSLGCVRPALWINLGD